MRAKVKKTADGETLWRAMNDYRRTIGLHEEGRTWDKLNAFEQAAWCWVAKIAELRAK